MSGAINNLLNQYDKKVRYKRCIKNKILHQKKTIHKDLIIFFEKKKGKIRIRKKKQKI